MCDSQAQVQNVSSMTSLPAKHGFVCGACGGGLHRTCVRHQCTACVCVCGECAWHSWPLLDTGARVRSFISMLACAADGIGCCLVFPLFTGDYWNDERCWLLTGIRTARCTLQKNSLPHKARLVPAGLKMNVKYF